ncbi:winged helix-turn-helix transcriptional regulator [Labilithrix luteola]|uniref:winged helix-turn-helix transcriptional regulator n=1 Tax=Labilithrix luteola TaxID=1391654 RepID=UPI001F0B16D6|nr:helix-turn-helix domain-containing protein [Labilithrix luteola]
MVTKPDSASIGAVEHANGIAREMFERIADKWTLLVVANLGEVELLRFTELQDRIGNVSHKMLTQTLRQLERDGLVTRTVHPVVPPRVDYRLTPLGRGLLITVTGICMWVRDNLALIETSRSTFDARSTPALNES